MYLIICMEKNKKQKKKKKQFKLFKIPLHLFRLLRKMHALSIEVLCEVLWVTPTLFNGDYF